jgi:hypothetical protein
MPPRRVNPLDPRDFVLLMTRMFRRIGYLPEELMRLIWNVYMELLTFTLIDRTNRRRYIRHKMVEDELDAMFDLNTRNDDNDERRYGPGFLRAQHDASNAICCKMSYCSVKRPQNSHPRPDRGAAVRNGEVELMSRGRGSSI